MWYDITNYNPEGTSDEDISGHWTAQIILHRYRSPVNWMPSRDSRIYSCPAYTPAKTHDASIPQGENDLLARWTGGGSLMIHKCWQRLSEGYGIEMVVMIPKLALHQLQVLERFLIMVKLIPHSFQHPDRSFCRRDLTSCAIWRSRIRDHSQERDNGLVPIRARTRVSNYLGTPAQAENTHSDITSREGWDLSRHRTERYP